MHHLPTLKAYAILGLFISFGWLLSQHAHPAILSLNAALLFVLLAEFRLRKWLREFPSKQTTNRYEMLLKTGQHQTLLALLEAQDREGNTPLITASWFSFVYAELDRYAEAEPWASKALNLFDAQHASRDYDRKIDAEKARFNLVFSLAVIQRTQGKYLEAARTIQENISYSDRVPSLIIGIAWYEYLGHAEDAARETLTGLDTTPEQINDSRPASKRETPDSVAYKLAYLQYKLLDVDTMSFLTQHAAALDQLSKEIEHYQDTPYGARLREILDDIRDLLRNETPA